jgi:MurNAc alpha-1-phosphate uridylyltransferase
VSLPVAILAGGLAKRLGSISQKIPKSLVDVAGKPFVIRQLHYLRRQGITNVVLCLGHLGDLVEAVVGDGSEFELEVRYSRDGSNLLGTGGALKKALPHLGDNFFVLYGDSYLPIDFMAVEKDFLSSGKPALMTVMRNVNQWDKSNVLFADGSILEHNKRSPKKEMAHIDYGLGIVSASALHETPDDKPFDLSDIYHELSIKGLLAGHEVFERFYEVGSPGGLEEASAYFSWNEMR